MITTPDLYNDVLLEPYRKGYRRLRILTGFASSAFLHHVSNELPSAEIELTIGMARKDGIRKWDHSEFMRLSKMTPNRIKVFYHIGDQPIHVKCLSWIGKNILSFVGSANFSWNGFGFYYEAMESINSLTVVPTVFNSVKAADCLDPNIADSVAMLEVPPNIDNVRSLKELAALSPRVNLNLFYYQNRVGSPIVHERSGLNWGQRPEYRRDLNQAYIPVPKEIHDGDPEFFPPRDHEFTIVTDDGQSFIAVMAQDNRKAIETKYDNSILGRYFRDRLELPRGSIISYEDLSNYGRMAVSIHKIGEDLYFMDFSRLHGGV